MSWTNTWMWRFRDVYLVPWKVNEEGISMDDVPATSFDSAAERERVASILEQYNDTLTLSPDLDSQFREIALARTSRNPLRTYLKIPLLRGLTLWFTPRVELLPYAGHMFPLRDEWREDRKDLLATLSLVIANGIYIAMAIVGIWIARRRPGVALLVVFILVRTAFFVQNDTPEPRYVLECFPAVIALAAQVFSKRPLGEMEGVSAA
jgi:hypothetical protein